MKKYYKLWIVVEEISDDDIRDLCELGEVEPVPMGYTQTVERAVELAESFDHSFDERD